MTEIRVAIAFQGGGARVVSLLSVAEAIYSLQKSHHFKISLVSGTSAGSIVAAILASGLDPKHFRERLERVAEKHVLNFENAVSTFSLARRASAALRGYSLLDRSVFDEFVSDFLGKDLSEAVLSQFPRLIVCAFDIKRGVPVQFTEKDSKVILVNALRYSCSIPIIFHSHKHESTYIDGGIVNNLPVDVLIDEVEKRQLATRVPKAEKMHVIAISFSKSSSYSISGIKNYLLALMSAGIDTHVYRSIKRVPAENIHRIQCSTKMLDFRQAIKDLSEGEYQKYYSAAEAFVESFCASARAGLDRLDAVEFTRRLSQYHESIR